MKPKRIHTIMVWYVHELKAKAIFTRTQKGTSTSEEPKKYTETQ